MKINALAEEINAKLFKRYQFQICIDGYTETLEDMDTILDVDKAKLFALSKEVNHWADYFVELNAALSIYIDMYTVVGDTYRYLMTLSKQNKTEFMILAPKYNISTRNCDTALAELTLKIEENKDFVKKMKIFSKILYSQEKKMTAYYYKTSKIISSIEKRMTSVGF